MEVKMDDQGPLIKKLLKRIEKYEKDYNDERAKRQEFEYKYNSAK